MEEQNILKWISSAYFQIVSVALALMVVQMHASGCLDLSNPGSITVKISSDEGILTA